MRKKQQQFETETSERITLWLRKEQLKRLEERKRRTGAPVAELIRRAIDRALEVRE